jgi:histidinol-phosphate/aromatic aminotransferase/cobyric acid decarboxylase-like protein
MQIELADQEDRRVIYRMRHDVYAREIAQHPTNAARELRDPLDAFNVYLVAREDGDDPAGCDDRQGPAGISLETPLRQSDAGRAGPIVGFISITPPQGGRFSVDKYFARHELPLEFDDTLYEVRLLTVDAAHRRRSDGIALLLMYAAVRYIEDHGGQRVVAIGRREILPLYRKVGLRATGQVARCGQVDFELLCGDVGELRRHAAQSSVLRRLARRCDWRLAMPLDPRPACFHGGGALFDLIGDDLAHLERRRQIVRADVLDAWFPPSPRVLGALSQSLDWLVRTSPPADCRGVLRAIAETRGVPSECLVPGAGSSDLIFRALRHWLTPRSRVLLLDPTYGEYAHVLGNVIGCRVDRLTLTRDSGYTLTRDSFIAGVTAHVPDLVILVNPNSPTGRHVPAAELRGWLAMIPPHMLVWIDETYVDYAGRGESLESFAVTSRNLVVCKSMSKAYALSGMRVGYLCGPATLMAELRALTPPWIAGMSAQVAAVNALKDAAYYDHRHRQTHALRRELHRMLTSRIGLDVVPGVANFLLAHLPADAPDAATVVARCRANGVLLRDASTMGTSVERRAIRIAVRSRAENLRIIESLQRAIAPNGLHRAEPPSATAVRASDVRY